MSEEDNLSIASPISQHIERAADFFGFGTGTEEREDYIRAAALLRDRIPVVEIDDPHNSPIAHRTRRSIGGEEERKEDTTNTSTSNDGSDQSEVDDTSTVEEEKEEGVAEGIDLFGFLPVDNEDDTSLSSWSSVDSLRCRNDNDNSSSDSSRTDFSKSDSESDSSSNSSSSSSSSESTNKMGEKDIPKFNGERDEYEIWGTR